MTTQVGQIKWLRVVVTALVVCLASFLTVLLIVTAYATYLGFQARGAPDTALIEAFAGQYAPWLGPISLILLTYLGAMHVARRVPAAAAMHGLYLGVLIGVLNLVIGGAFDLVGLLTAALTTGVGWLGGKQAGKS